VNVDRLAEIAVEFVMRLRTEDAEANGRWLDEQLPSPEDWRRMLFVLGAAVPCGKTEPDWLRLTEWTLGDPNYVDEIAVERACKGEPIHLTRAERRAAMDKLVRRGMPARQIAAMFGVSDRTVRRVGDAQGRVQSHPHEGLAS